MKAKTIFIIVLAWTMGFWSVPSVQAQDSQIETIAMVEILENNSLRERSAEITDEGVWLKDPITGCGVWNSAPKGNEMISWSGECRDGKASGYGVLVWLEDGKISITLSNGDTKEQIWNKGKKVLQ